MRCAKLVKTFCSIFVPRVFKKFSLLRTKSRVSSNAVAVALRQTWFRIAISPKISPSFRMATINSLSLSMWEIFTLPLSTR